MTNPNYKCFECAHNNEDNVEVEFCEVCEEGHCILCMQSGTWDCTDFKEREVIE